MGTATAEVKTNYRLGNYVGTNLVLADLTTGPEGSKSTFKYEPGDVYDLREFFDEKELRRSRSLRDAITNGWLKPVEGDVTQVPKNLSSIGNGPAPPNEFDERLVEVIDKEKEEEDRLKESTADALANRARRTREYMASKKV